MRRRDEAKVTGAVHELSDVLDNSYEWRDETDARYIDHAVLAYLGGYGAGKTTLACVSSSLAILRNPRTEAYGGDYPRSYILAPTGPTLHDTAIHRFEAVVPPALIASRVKSPWTVTWVHGGVTYGKSADATNEGFEGCVLHAEEIDKPEYWRNPLLWPNLVARIRDPHAALRRIVVSGLPTAGNVRQKFDRPDVVLRLLATVDNPAIDLATMNEIRQACPAGQENLLLKGDWMQPPGAVFQYYDSSVHLLPVTAYNPKEPTHMALDVGNHGYYCKYQARKVQITGVTGQKTWGLGILFLHEGLILGQSVEDLCIAAKADGWEVTPRLGCVAMDPTVRFEERKMVARYYPGNQIIQREKTDPYYFVPEGIRLMQAAIRDSLGNHRFFALRPMARNKNGLTDALTTARYHERTGELVKDDRTDHARDGGRYATCHILGKGQGTVQVRQ